MTSHVSKQKGETRAENGNAIRILWSISYTWLNAVWYFDFCPWIRNKSAPVLTYSGVIANVGEGRILQGLRDGSWSDSVAQEENIKPLRPSGNYMNHLLWQSVMLHFVFIGFAWFSLWTDIISLNSVKKLIDVMVKFGVLFEVRTEFLNNI
jgi:D-alanyl-lipoteichoic acid acyltransferase DltB (MBOAT superfamily)